MYRYFIFAGEPSGDLHGSKLLHLLKSGDASSQFFGVGGPLMRAEGLQGSLIMENFQVMGFSDVFKALPRLWKYFYQIVNEILKQSIQVVILIDYPGFNLRLAKALRKRNYTGKIIQYVCPSVWAHGKKRITSMVNTLDLLLTIYPFEKTYFSETSLKVEYVGNPLLENLNKWHYDANWKAASAIPHLDPLIALFPGSRPSEIKRHFPLQLAAATLLKEQFPSFKFACSYVDKTYLPEMQNFLNKTSLKIEEDFFFVPAQFRYELMHCCSIALAKSGTITLELALLKKPTVVIYELSRFNYFLAKYFLGVELPYYCIVNILANREIFPEFIGLNLPITTIAKTLQTLHENPIHQEKISQDCQHIINQLGESETHKAAAHAILGLLK